MVFRTYLIGLTLVGALVVSCGTQQSDSQNDQLVQAAISEIMDNQQKAWNEGDLNSFMAGYWESDSLQFIGKSGVNEGWQNTLENYKKGYPNSAAMGQLQFSNLTYKPLGDAHFLVVGKWHLTRDSLEDLQGHYSLIWQCINNKWVIITDHSS